MQCPVCGVVNEPDRTQCVCGFELGAADDRVTQELQREMAKVVRQTWIGAAVVVIVMPILILIVRRAFNREGDYSSVLSSTAVVGGIPLVVGARRRLKALRARLPARRK